MKKMIVGLLIALSTLTVSVFAVEKKVETQEEKLSKLEDSYLAAVGKGDIDKAIKIAESIIEQTIDTDLKVYASVYYGNLGFLYVQKKEYQKAYDTYETGSDLYNPNSINGLADFYYNGYGNVVEKSPQLSIAISMLGIDTLRSIRDISEWDGPKDKNDLAGGMIKQLITNIRVIYNENKMLFDNEKSTDIIDNFAQGALYELCIKSLDGGYCDTPSAVKFYERVLNNATSEDNDSSFYVPYAKYKINEISLRLKSVYYDVLKTDKIKNEMLEILKVMANGDDNNTIALGGIVASKYYLEFGDKESAIQALLSANEKGAIYQAAFLFGKIE